MTTKLRMPTERESRLDQLLLPIKWSMSSSVRERQNYVAARHQEVRAVMPFLTDEEKERAKAWTAANLHPGLWD